MEREKWGKDIEEYLIDNKFSSAVRARLIARKPFRIPTRIDLVVERTKGRRVIHIGCSDHPPVIREKIANNSWLHKLICESASECCGIDIDVEGLEIMRSLGYERLYRADIVKDEVPAEIKKEKWDIVVLGEIIEHLTDPVSFLKQLRSKFAGIAEEVLITTPNAFKTENFWNALHNVEIINSDHKFWFTPYTLAKAAYLSGMAVNDITFCQSYRVSKFAPRKRAILTMYPALMDTILMAAEIPASGLSSGPSSLYSS